MSKGFGTSLLAIMTVAAFCSDAFAVASVRTIGGAGTYASASAAAADGSNRAGSLRTGGFVRPGTSVSTTGVGSAGAAGVATVQPKVSTSTSGSVSGAATTSGGSVSTGGAGISGRSASMPRLSIGKYIGTPVSVSTHGPSNNDLDLRIDRLERDVSELQENKQDMLSGTEYITVDQDNNEVILELEAVREALALQDGREIEADADNDTGVLVRYIPREGEPETEWETLITWEELRNRLSLGEMNDAITASINDLSAEIAKKLDKLAGADKSGRVMTVDTDGYIKPGVIIADELNAKLDNTVDLDTNPDAPGKAVIVDDEGNLVPTGDFYTRDEVDSIINEYGIDNLGALAYKDQIKDEDIASDAAIARSKLAGDISDILNWIEWWKQNAPTDGKYVLSVDENGNKQWFRVVVDAEDGGRSADTDSNNANSNTGTSYNSTPSGDDDSDAG
ncbi:MAG: hypothetical protein J6T57_04430 [Alphaproteobacteria bacterium]|nr:hypothetical protein [Alphaproteobacteria bacterium]